MKTEPKQLVEAKSRRGMVQMALYFPARLHRALMAARKRDRISANAAVREAIEMWLAARRRAGKGDR